MNKKANIELATILQNNKDQLRYIVPNSWKYRALFAITRCRTKEMGGHIDKCNNDTCGRLHLSYNSCRNRHCPKCQGHKREQWIEAREVELLNCSYFHVVFTLPEVLNELALRHPKEVYNTLFKVSWSTLKGFSGNPKFLGAHTGMISVLHTWGQNLSLHPHLHCIVPAGGLTQKGKWRTTKSKGKFLFPVKTMSSVFRAQFIDELRKHVDVPQQVAKQLFAKRWVIYAKQPFYGPKQVIEYLGRYTHKIAISNHRIIKAKNGLVWFKVKNYKSGGKQEIAKLTEEEFIRRFALHILPKGYTRIRHYGILSSTSKKKCKVTIDADIGLVTVRKKYQSQHRLCPSCKKGRLETIMTFDQRGPPAYWKQQM